MKQTKAALQKELDVLRKQRDTLARKVSDLGQECREKGRHLLQVQGQLLEARNREQAAETKAVGLSEEVDRLSKRIDQLVAERNKKPPRDVEHQTTHCLEQARKAVIGDRARDYGKPSINHARTAAMWSAYFDGQVKIDARDVCQLLILQKASRDRHLRKPDNVVDQAGYAQNAAWLQPEEINKLEGLLRSFPFSFTMPEPSIFGMFPPKP